MSGEGADTVVVSGEGGTVGHREFTVDDARKLIGEARALLSKVEDTIEAGRFVEAEAWWEAVSDELMEQDVFGMLAARERLAVMGVPVEPDDGRP